MGVFPAKQREWHPYRWVICALLFFATTINYMDRQILGVLAPRLQETFSWSEVDYAWIVTSFQAAYAVGLLVSGWLIDRIGSRMGLLVAVGLWSLASMAHGWASSVAHFAMARGALGLSEAGNFPASIKVVSEWFPERERAFAIGIFNSGSNVGAILTPLLVPWIVMTWGWETAFFVSGGIGFLWVLSAAYLLSPSERDVTGVGKKEALSSSGRESSLRRGAFADVLRSRATWGFALAKFLTDPIWWFYLYWSPKYLSDRFGVSLTGLAAPLVVIYLMADVGSIGGGWASARFMKRGSPAVAARLKVMLLCALSVLTVVYAAFTDSLWLGVSVVAIAAAAHQGWSANLFAIVSDLFPKEQVASVVGFGGMCGAVGGMGIALVTGFVLESTGSYVVPFAICSASYITAWIVVRCLVSDDGMKRHGEMNE